MNGWTNYETWNFMLWYGDYFQDLLQEMKDEGQELTHEQVYEMIEEHIDQMLDEKELKGFLGDIVGHAVQQINIHEIVEELLEVL